MGGRKIYVIGGRRGDLSVERHTLPVPCSKAPTYAGRATRRCETGCVVGSTPAYAGRTATRYERSVIDEEAPPHMRGVRVGRHRRRALDGSTPAYAGRALPVLRPFGYRRTC